MDYKINYSKRKTIGLRIKNGELYISAPYKTDSSVIDGIVKKHFKWIEKNLEKSRARSERFPELSSAEILEMKNKAKKKNLLKEKS